jgi:6-phosphogluconolactonase
MAMDLNMQTLYIGTYTRPEGHVDGRGEGVYVYQFDSTTGHLSHQSTCPGVVNPSFLTVEPQGQYLYAVNELTREEEGSGTVSAFAIDPSTGNLAFLNKQSSGGLAPAYVSMDQSGRFVFVANYITGNVAVLPVQANGELLPASDMHQHRGTGLDPRQGNPHAHCVLSDPAGRFILSADLGIDQIMIYRFDHQWGKLLLHDPPFAALPPGGGPRHLIFHPNGQFLYVVTEYASTIALFHYDGQQGQLHQRQTVSTLPDDFTGFSTGADIRITPDGRFLYASNRGHDSLAIFAVHEESGQLTLVGYESTQGKTPRNFTLDPAGQFLLVANQDSDAVVVFHIDQENGKLTPTGESYSIPSPACLQFAPT